MSTSRIEKVDPILHRLVVTAPSGLSVNLWLLRVDGLRVLIDTGFTHTVAQWEELLAREGLRVEDLDHILVTHTHEDHLGGAVVLADRLRAPVWAWEGSRPVFENFYGYHDELGPWSEQTLSLVPAGPLRDAFLEMREKRPRRPLRQGGDGTVPTARRVRFGEVVELGSLRLQCVDGRGHDPHHAGWLELERGWFFGGDALLRSPTPLIPSMRDDIGRYRETLLRWRDTLTASWLLPGHGAPDADPAGAIEGSIGHLRALYGAVREAAEGSDRVDPAALAATLAGGSGPSWMQRAFVMLANVTSQLRELEQYGAVERCADGWWIRRGEIPEFDALKPVASPVQSPYPEHGAGEGGPNA